MMDNVHELIVEAKGEMILRVRAFSTSSLARPSGLQSVDYQQYSLGEGKQISRESFKLTVKQQLQHSRFWSVKS